MTPDAPTAPSDDTAARLARLEAEVAALRAEVATLRAPTRAALGEPLRDPLRDASRASSALPRVASAPAPRARDGIGGQLGARLAALRGGDDLEALVGRYGTVAIAALLILMGVGAFLTWAFATFTVGPAARVGLGALVAAGLAGAGWRLRTRGNAPAFGNTLLGIALAVVHVDAWGAGPALGLVPDGVALAVAALASAAVAALAWRSGEQALFVVGVGGALVAPFVTGPAEGHPAVLAGYGWVALGAGLLALPRDRDWPLATRLLAVGGAGYVAALADGAQVAARLGDPAALGLAPWSFRTDAPALLALALAASALAAAALRLARPGPAARVALAHLAAGLAALLALALDQSGGVARWVGYALAGAVLTLLAARPAHADAAARAARREGRLVGALPDAASFVILAVVVLPLGYLAEALAALPDPDSPAGAAVAAVWGAVALAAAALARRAGAAPVLTSAHVAAGGLASALALPFLLQGELATALATAAHAVAFAALLGWAGHRLALLPVLVSLVGASGVAAWLLDRRVAYAYAPFLTRASLAALAAVAAWGAVAWLVARRRPVAAAEARVPLLAAAPLAALLWGREELRRAVSPEVSTSLLVAYFAAAGIACIAVGRARRVTAARVAGLALAIYAAAKAVLQVSRLESVGLRVGSYLLVGGFLLAVGWWYRAGGAPAGSSSAPLPAGDA